MCNNVTGTICTNGMAYNPKIQSVLKLPFAGYRDMITGYYNNQSVFGFFWSSSPTGTDAFYLSFSINNIRPTNGYNRAYSFSVRCLKDSTTLETPSCTSTIPPNSSTVT